MATYLKIFNFLWRTKRMEFYLAEVWSKQVKMLSASVHLLSVCARASERQKAR